MGTHSSYQLGCLSWTDGQQLLVTLLEVSEREGCSGHTPTHLAFKTCLEPVPRYEPSTY